MTTQPAIAEEVPTLGDDPFGRQILTDPYPFHRELRDLAPVVFLSRYGVYAMGRFDEVHASLLDWQTFVSSRGAGLSDFAKEQPWRPPSLLLEADPPDHSVVRKAMGDVMSPATMRKLREGFQAKAESLADRLVEQGTFDAVSDLAEKYPLEVFPDAVGLQPGGRENLLPYGALAFNAFGPHNELLEAALAKAAPVQEWVLASCQRDALAPGGFGAQIWRSSPSTRRFAGSHRCRRSSEPRHARWLSEVAVFRRAQKYCCSWVPRTGIRATGAWRLTGSTSAAAPPGMSLSAWESTNASASQWPGWKQRWCSRHWRPGSVRSSSPANPRPV